jgi:hypothetical protein
MQRPPCLRATKRKLGFTAEFPFGEESSRFVGSGHDPHPRYGHGLLLIQSFRVSHSPAEAIRLALSLNADELTRKPAGYGFGSHCYRDGCIHFTTFVPNAVHPPGLFPSFYYAGAGRAWHLSKLLRKDDWGFE